MKIAKEICEEINKLNEVPLSVIEEASHNPITEQQVKQIQLDAMKEGARRAAEKCDKNIMDETYNEGDWHMTESAKQIKEAILTTAEQWTKKDL